MSEPVAAEAAAALELTSISKSFDGVRALDDVHLTLEVGQVHCLLGANGSGKSTLVKILTGFHAPDDGGELRLFGERLPLPIRQAGHHGIAVIHQDLALVDDLSVLDNVGVVRRFGSARGAPISARRERVILAELQRRVGTTLAPDTKVSQLGPAERAFTAVLRAMRQIRDEAATPVLILDEPTAYLTRRETAEVIGLMRGVCSAGGAVLFITHDLDEALSVGDRVTVLVNGRVALTTRPGATSRAGLIRTMLGGREIADKKRRDDVRPGPVVVEARSLVGATVRGVSFDVAAGEVVGVAGLAGAGHEELPYLVAGVVPLHGGDVTVRAREDDATAVTGVALVPANRARDGLWLDAKASENMTLPRLRRYLGRWGIRSAAEQRDAASWMQAFGVVPSSPDWKVKNFSGGNQQKVLLAKWMADRPRVLVMHEPTQGVDVGARSDILDLVAGAADDGAAVLICSSDHDELTRVCDRVLIIKDGELVGQLSGADIDETQILTAIS